jgi:hypothetical protein
MSNSPEIKRSDFVSYDDLKGLFPIQPPPSRATVLRWARAGKFPKFFRAGIGYQEPQFNRQEVEAWIFAHYAPFFAVKVIGDDWD